MKKILLSLLAGVASLGVSNAQVTITEADLAPINSEIYYGNDTLPIQTLSVKTPGTGQVWDFSGSLNNHYTDTTGFYDPNDTINLTRPNLFDTANYCIRQISLGDTNYYYARKTWDRYAYVGLKQKDIFAFSGLPVVGFYNPHETLLKFPMMYGDTLLDTSKMTVTLYAPDFEPAASGYIDSIRITRYTWKKMIVGGEGSIVLPDALIGTPALRLDILDSTIQTIEFKGGFVGGPTWALADNGFLQNYNPNLYNTMYFNGESYEFWGNNKNGVLATFIYNYFTGDLRQVVYQSGIPVVSTKQLASKTGLTSYPNPANASITLNLNGIENATKAIIYDLTGKVVAEIAIANQEKANINVANFANGIYNMLVVKANGSLAGSTKIAIQH